MVTIQTYDDADKLLAEAYCPFGKKTIYIKGIIDNFTVEGDIHNINSKLSQYTIKYKNKSDKIGYCCDIVEIKIKEILDIHYIIIYDFIN